MTEPPVMVNGSTTGRWVALVAIVAVAAMIAGFVVFAVTSRNDQLGSGLPVQQQGQSYPGSSEVLHGSLNVETNGCFTVDDLRGRATRLEYAPFIAAHGGNQSMWDTVAGFCVRSGKIDTDHILVITSLR